MKNYQSLAVPGSFLLPGFSIYLLEIDLKKNGEKNKWFYIGMTGDPFYPSARAPFHRISGHLELSKHSTQNQLMVALRKQGVDENDYNDLTINMHHYAIDGYKK